MITDRRSSTELCSPPQPKVPSSLDEWLAAPGAHAPREAYERVQRRECVFITGAAGTGKSLFLQLLVDALPSRPVVLAPTGVAALRVEGETIHSFFRLPHGVLTAWDVERNEGDFRQLQVVVIDEVSMVRADLMDAVDRLLRRAKQKDIPFGGVQLVLCGDLLQLPPVADKDQSRELRRLGYHTGSFFFNAKVFQETRLHVVRFDEVHRQKDQAFVDLLNSIRLGRAPQYLLTSLNVRVGPGPGTHARTSALTLTTRRAQADSINTGHLGNLPGAAMCYTGLIEGKFPHRHMPVPQNVTLKPGAKVMFVKNDSDRRWVNGSLGTVVECTKDLVRVQVEEGATHDVHAVTWDRIEHKFKAEAACIEKTVVGRYRQLPLLLGWAATIHKSQGITLRRVHLDLGHGAFAPGQVYVGLSRCQDLSGLTLAGPIISSDVIVDSRVLEFLRSACPETADEPVLSLQP